MKRGSAQPTAARPLERRYAVYFYIAVFFLCIGASFLLYANSLPNEFVFDDVPLIVENKFIKDGTNLPRMFSPGAEQYQYRPVRFVSYMLDYWLWGLKPAGYRGANIVYHGIAGFILFLVLVELAGNWGAAVAGAVLFISHPVLTDSVTYISGRRDVLVGLFYLLSFYCFVRYRKEPRLGECGADRYFFSFGAGVQGDGDNAAGSVPGV